MSKSLLEKIIEDMLNQVEKSGVFDDLDLEYLKTLASQGNLSSESSLRQLIEVERLADEDSQD